MIELLNKDQKKAADEIGLFLNSNRAHGVFTLTGGPGTGKTFMLKAALDEYKQSRKVICGTVSHAARNVLSDAMDGSYDCYTVAQLLGMSMKINENDGSYYFESNKRAPQRIREATRGILVLDEVSMIDDGLFDLLNYQIEKFNIKCIAVGDPFQLPPVEQEHDSMYFDHIGATLTIPMRFGGPVAKLAKVYHDAIEGINEDEHVSNWVLNEKTLRANNLINTNGYEFGNDLDKMLDIAAQDIKNHYEDKNHTRILAFRNAAVKHLNDQIRLRIYGSDTKQYEPGEIVISDGGYTSNYKSILYNGQVLKVESFKEVDNHPSGLPVLKLKFEGLDHSVLPPIYTLKNDPEVLKNYEQIKNNLILRAKENNHWGRYARFMSSFAHFTYGYAQNLYKCQGATLSNVYVCEGEIMDVKPLTLKQKFQGLYVAMTRAKEKVYIYNKNF